MRTLAWWAALRAWGLPAGSRGREWSRLPVCAALRSARAAPCLDRSRRPPPLERLLLRLPLLPPLPALRLLLPLGDRPRSALCSRPPRRDRLRLCPCCCKGCCRCV